MYLFWWLFIVVLFYEMANGWNSCELCGLCSLPKFQCFCCLDVSGFCSFQQVTWTSKLALCYWQLLRYLSLAHPLVSESLFKKNRNKFIVLGIWVYAFILILPSLYMKSFGYNHQLGKCDYIHDEGQVDPMPIFFSVAFGIPALMIVLCYFGIWKTVHQSSNFRIEMS